MFALNQIRQPVLVQSNIDTAIWAYSLAYNVELPGAALAYRAAAVSNARLGRSLK